MSGPGPVPVLLGDEPPGRGTGHPDPAERRRRRAVAVVGAALAVALLAVAVVASLAQQRQAAARRAALDALGWVLPALEEPLEPAWSGPAGWTVATTDDLLVLADEEGSRVLRGVDAATGEVVWERSGAERCAPVSSTTSDLLAPDRPARLLVCVPASNDVRGLPATGATTRVSAVDPATGEHVAGLDVAGSFLLQHAVDDDVVVGFVHPDGAFGAVRWSARDGRVRWTFRGEPGVLPEGVLGPWGHRVSGGVLTLEAAGRAGVDLGTGEARPGEEDVLLDRHVFGDGSAAVWRYDAAGVARDLGLVAPDGTLRFELPGVPWLSVQDDGSAPDVLVVQEPAGLAGLDATTGAPLWRVPGQFWGRSPLLLEGRAVAVGPRAVSVVDVGDGAVVWTRPAAVTAPAALTDGRLLLLPLTIRGTGHLVALDLATGAEAWRAPAPADAVDVRVVAGTVVVVGGQETAGLRPATAHGSRG